MMKSVVLYSLPRMGHMISMVELGKLLLAQSQSLSSITILIPSFPFPHDDNVFSYISSVSSSFHSITFHSLPPIPLLDKSPSEYPNVEEIVYQALRDNNPSVSKALETLTRSSHVCAFILDFFCYSALQIPRSLNIPTHFFFPSGACGLALFLNFPVFDKIATDSFRKLNNKSFEIPGLFSVPSSQMLEPMLDRGVGYDEFVKTGDDLAKADGIIVNSFEALESRAVRALKDGTCLPGARVPPVHCIGPLIANEAENSGDRHECLKWLDSNPSKSVVYLCFGSRGLFSKEQIREIALGLERSGVRFLWVVRAPPSEARDINVKPVLESELVSLLPEGFMDRTKDRGLVVNSWAPQVAVLAHDSVGGFVTHCGWNSTLEAICDGVPMVAWPLYAEQRFNKIVLVQEIGIALPMNESEDRFVSSDEIEIRLKQIMYSEEGDVVRKRVSELSDAAKVALKEDGSSKTTLSMLVESWIR